MKLGLSILVSGEYEQKSDLILSGVHVLTVHILSRSNDFCDVNCDFTSNIIQSINKGPYNLLNKLIIWVIFKLATPSIVHWSWQISPKSSSKLELVNNDRSSSEELEV